MTWSKAMPVLVLAVFFDLARIFFKFFWFTGPAIAAFACTYVGNSALGVSVGDIIGSAVAGVCTGVAAAAGTVAYAALVIFGEGMSDAIDLIGWITIGTIVAITNAQLLKRNSEDFSHVILLYVSILISFLPIIGTIPTVSMITYKLYKFQIKIEKEALQRYQEEQQEEALEQRREMELAMAAQQASQDETAQEYDENEYLDEDQPFDAQVPPLPVNRRDGRAANDPFSIHENVKRRA